MSLFASLGQGDVWALSGISFASPINDLLEKGEFTLENLLEEDELIQEVKAKNEQLTEFLSQESTIDHLLDFIITPAESLENELRVFKYPYMSCEVICCEIPEILHVLVETRNGVFLDKLFTFLDKSHSLDYYLAGYFEKILEMLFRRMTVPMMKYFNDAGVNLLVKFLEHMDNYSIMQIVQRLMLPHIPFANLNDNDTDFTDEERILRQCNWSFSTESCDLLFNHMLEQKDADVPLHISDLLITVLQLSPPETLVISYLCEPSCVERMMRAIVGEVDENGEECALLDIAMPGDTYSSAASVSLAAISVLESLNSRLFEASLPFDQSMTQIMEDNQDHLAIVRQQIEVVCQQILPFIPRLRTILHQYLECSPCQPIVNQSKTQVNRLGHRGLQLVKLVESVVRMGSDAVDESFCRSGLFRTCLDLYFHFDNNSFLHLSVQRIVITVLESDSSRSTTQRHLLTECGLLNTLMSGIEKYNTTSSSNLDLAPGDNFDGKTHTTEKRGCMTPKHSSIMGNLVLIAQALSVALDAEGGASLAQDMEYNSTQGCNETDTQTVLGEGREGVEDGRNVDMISMDKPGSLRALFDAVPDSSLPEHQEGNLAHMLKEWDTFVAQTLHGILDHQMVGSYSAIANISSVSQDDPLKLGVDLDVFHINNWQGAGCGGTHGEIDSNEMWQRNQFDEEDDEEDDFMFHGPATTSHDYDHANIDSFQPHNEFTKRQDLSMNGFQNASSSTVEAFADFSSFETDGMKTGEVALESNNAEFEEFVSFANFEQNNSLNGVKSTEGTDSLDDIMSTEF